MTKKIVIEPITRVEGTGKVTIDLDDSGKVSRARLHILEFRGFERFIQSRPYWEVPVVVQRLCGICPVSHHLAAAKAIDEIVGVGHGEISVLAEKMRRLMHYGQVFQSHALHFFYLAAPDLLLGIESDYHSRNIVGLVLENPALAKKGVDMRMFGQHIIKATAGKRIHGISAVPGGIHKTLSIEERDSFLDGKLYPSIDTMIDWVQETIEYYKDYHKKHQEWIDAFAFDPANSLSLRGKNGELDLYHGDLHCVDPEGKVLLDMVDYHDYNKVLAERTETWSYMKFPYIRELGKEHGWYRVGPLARLNVCDYIPTPLAQKEFEAFRAYTGGKPNHMTMHTHMARLIEILHCCEMIKQLLHDGDLQDGELTRKGTRRSEGIGLIEAPRGTLFHHYAVDDKDAVTSCNLIVSTTNNNIAMNRVVQWVAENEISEKPKVTEGMLNKVEVAIRAYDPCLSCATHAIGKMPLRVSIFDAKGQLIDENEK